MLHRSLEYLARKYEGTFKVVDDETLFVAFPNHRVQGILTNATIKPSDLPDSYVLRYSRLSGGVSEYDYDIPENDVAETIENTIGLI